jgi:hypothetical protein
MKFKLGRQRLVKLMNIPRKVESLMPGHDLSGTSGVSVRKLSNNIKINLGKEGARRWTEDRNGEHLLLWQ